MWFQYVNVGKVVTIEITIIEHDYSETMKKY